MMRFLALVLCLAGVPPQEPTGGLSGTVTLGLLVELPKGSGRLRVDCPKAAEGPPILREDLVVDAERRVRWAAVYVKKGLEGRRFPVPETPGTLVTREHRFDPHVLLLQTRQTLVLRNEDDHRY